MNSALCTHGSILSKLFLSLRGGRCVPGNARMPGIVAQSLDIMRRHYRLRRNSDFQRVRQSGKFKASSLMVLAFLRNELDHSRFGFAVSKRMGKAVQRNKIKRRLREAIRLRLPHIKPGFDCVFIARQPIREATYQEIEQMVEYLLRKNDLWQD